MTAELVKYADQFQVGLSFTVHSHGCGRHMHLWIDIGKYCLEFTVFEGET